MLYIMQLIKNIKLMWFNSPNLDLLLKKLSKWLFLLDQQWLLLALLQFSSAPTLHSLTIVFL